MSARQDRASLSYMQLIEAAVVAAFRDKGVSLNKIRKARAYVAEKLTSNYPFAEYRFKTNGSGLFMDYEEIEGPHRHGTLLRADQDGQLAWSEIIGRLEEFEYEYHDIVTKWHVAGRDSEVVIDPRMCFGAPVIAGTPTWVLKGRHDAGESIEDIAEEFELDRRQVIEGLAFEGIEIKAGVAANWTH
ncbi:MAG TPA: DUF433 domain-containing protein [Stellaceae bacterium]|nr:DUF433 domain-containing protein [Stellaceae bacterium]